jgi:hypothetical protein
MGRVLSWLASFAAIRRKMFILFFSFFQVETLPDVLVPRHCQDQEEDDLLFFIRHPEEGLCRRAQGHPVQRRRRPRTVLHRGHP